MVLKPNQISIIHYVGLLAILIVSGWLGFYTLDYGQAWGGDFALYLGQARSIVNCNMQALLDDNSFAMQNSSHVISPDLYPWGAPLIFSPFIHFFGMDLIKIKGLLLLIYWLCLPLLFFLFRKKIPPSQLLILVSFFAFNPFLISFNNVILSDIPFFFVSILTILIIDIVVVKKSILLSPWIDALILGLLIFYSFFTKKIGIVFFPTLMICQIITYWSEIKLSILNFFSKHKFLLLPYLVAVMLYQLSTIIFPEGGYYSGVFTNLSLQSLMANFLHYSTLETEFFKPAFTDILFGFTLPFFLFGIIKNYRTDYLFIAFCFTIFSVLLIFPDQQGLRYLLPILPFYIYFFLRGLFNPAFKISCQLKCFGKFGTINFNILFATYISVKMLLASFDPAYDRYVNGRYVEYGPYWGSSQKLFDWLEQNTSKQSVMIFWKPRVLHFFTNRRSIISNTYEDVMTGKGNYLIFYSSGDYDQISIEDEKFQANIHKFKLVYENYNYKVYKFGNKS